MKLTIHLQAGLPGQADDVFEVDGETLIKNGTRYDLSAVPEGGEATPEGDDHPFIGTITRTNSALSAGIVWRYNTTTDEPDQGGEPIQRTVSGGVLSDPVARKPEPMPEPEPEPDQTALVEASATAQGGTTP